MRACVCVCVCCDLRLWPGLVPKGRVRLVEEVAAGRSPVAHESRKLAGVLAALDEEEGGERGEKRGDKHQQMGAKTESVNRFSVGDSTGRQEGERERKKK